VNTLDRIAPTVVSILLVLLVAPARSSTKSEANLGVVLQPPPSPM
jgi:hypothetical protein